MLDLFFSGLFGIVTALIVRFVAGFFEYRVFSRTLKNRMCMAATKKSDLDFIEKLLALRNQDRSITDDTDLSWISKTKDFASEVERKIIGLTQSQMHPHLRDPLCYSFLQSGKMVRAKLAYLIGESLKLDHGLLVELGVAIELEHAASLIHDDIVDEASYRRSRLSQCVMYGNSDAVLHGDYLVAMVVDQLTKIGNIEITRSFAKSMEELVRGELLQAAGAADISLKSYLLKSYCKTGSLFKTACESASILAGEDREDFIIAGTTLGLAFQLIDDCLDFDSTSADLGKPADGADLLQGNITAPVILSGLDFESFSDDIPTLVEAVRNSSGVSEARKLGMEFAAVAGSRFDKVVKQRDLKIAINGFTHSIVNRKS